MKIGSSIRLVVLPCLVGLSLILPSSSRADQPRPLRAILLQLEEPNSVGQPEARSMLDQLSADRDFASKLRGFLKDPDPHVRRAAAEYESYRPDPEAYQLLLEAAKDADGKVRGNAARALGVQLGHDVIPVILAMLTDDSDEAREGAAYALTHIHDPRCVVPVIGLLKDPSTEVRKHACWAIHDYQDLRALDSLVELTKDNDNDVVDDAAAALGGLKDPKAVKALIPLLKSPNMYVHGRAAQSLSSIGELSIGPLADLLGSTDAVDRMGALTALSDFPADSVRALVEKARNDSNENVKAKAVSALISFGDARSVDLAISLLGAGDPKVRQQGIGYLGELRDPHGVMPLVGMFRDANQEVRISAIRTFDQIKDSRAVPGLINCLHDKHQAVVVSAVSALGNQRDKRAGTPLLSMLNTHDDRALCAIIEALGRIGEPRAIEPLIALAKRGTPDGEETNVGAKAVEMLGCFHDPRATNALISALKSSDLAKADAAAMALQGIKDNRIIKPLCDYIKRSGDQSCAMLLGDFGKAALQPVLELSRNKDSGVRETAAEAMGEIRVPVAVPRLLTLLQDSDTGVCCSAIRSLGTIRDQRATAKITLLLKDRNAGVRCAVVDALALLSGVKAVPLLIPMLKDSSADVQRSAIGELVKIGDRRAIQPLISAMNARSLYAIPALGDLHAVEAVDPLIAVLKKTDNAYPSDGADAMRGAGIHRGYAAMSLGEIGDSRAIGPLMAALGEKDPGALRDILEALGRLHASEAESVLRVKLSSQGFEERCGAMAGLAWLGDSQSVGPIINLLKDPNWQIRSEAVKALGKMRDRRAVQPLIDYYHDRRAGNGSSSAIEALRSIGDPSAFDVCMEALVYGDINAPIAAAQALGDLHDFRAVHPLIMALKTEDTELRSAAATALTSITGEKFGEKQELWLAWWKSHGAR